MKLKALLIIILSIFCTGIRAENIRRDTLVVEDLSDDFLVYSSDFGTYVPVLKPEGNVVNLHLDFSRYKDYLFSFKADPGTSMLVDYKLIYQNTGKASEDVFIPVSEIQKTAGKHLVSVYNENSMLPEKIQIAHIGNPYERIGEVFYSVRIRKGGESEFYLFLTILTLFTIIKNRYPKRLTDSLNFFRSSSGEEAGAISDLFSSSSLAIILLNSMCFAYLYALVQFPGLNGSIPFVQLMIIILLIFCSFYVKYFMLKIVGGVFNMVNVARLHFVEIVKFALVFNLVMVPLLTLISFSETLNLTFPHSAFVMVLLGGLALVLFKLLLLTFRVPDFKYIYLFSYLCVGELIPLGFILKITLL
jgi:hypothetical protein